MPWSTRIRNTLRCVSCDRASEATWPLWPCFADFDDLIQTGADCRKLGTRQSAHRVGSGLTNTPVKRFRLMPQHVTCFARVSAFCRPDGDGERIVCVALGRCHGQSDDEGGSFVENPGRKNQEWVDVAHFLAGLRVAVDPDNGLALRYPEWTSRFCRFLHGQFSAPTDSAAIDSPPCRTGSNCASFSFRERSRFLISVITKWLFSTVIRTRLFSCSLASLAMADGILRPKLFPQRLMSRTSSGMSHLLIKLYKH